MMKLVYTGLADERRIRANDFPHLEDDFEDVVWYQGGVQEVSDSVGEWLLTHHRTQFREWVPEAPVEPGGEPTPLSDMTIVDLRALAKRYQDEGWKFKTPITKMKRGALMDELTEIMEEEAGESGDQAMGSPSGSDEDVVGRAE